MQPVPRVRRSGWHAWARILFTLNVLLVWAWRVPTYTFLAVLTALCFVLLFMPPFVLLLPLCERGLTRLSHLAKRTMGHGASPPLAGA